MNSNRISLLDALPPELLTEVTKHLSTARDMARFEQINRACRNSSADSSWRHLVGEELGFTVVASAATLPWKQLYRRARGAAEMSAEFYATFRACDTRRMHDLWSVRPSQIPPAAAMPHAWIVPMTDLPLPVQRAVENKPSAEVVPLPEWGKPFCRHPGDQDVGLSEFGLAGERAIGASWNGILGSIIGSRSAGIDIRPQRERWEISSCGTLARCSLEERISGLGVGSSGEVVLPGMLNAFLYSRNVHQDGAAPEGSWRVLMHDSPHALPDGCVQLPAKRVWVADAPPARDHGYRVP